MNQSQISSTKKNFPHTGRKKLSELPKNFFENLLDLELKLKLDFSIDTLNELVYQYSMVIEYYESRNEFTQHNDFQNRMSFLLSQPEILKKMKGYSSISKNPNPLQEQEYIDYENKAKIDQEKMKIKMKVDYMTQLSCFPDTEEKVHKILTSMDSKEGIETAKSLLDEEISKQEDNFKQKLQRKRTKTVSSKPQKILQQIEEETVCTNKESPKQARGKASNPCVISLASANVGKELTSIAEEQALIIKSGKEERYWEEGSNNEEDGGKKYNENNSPKRDDEEESFEKKERRKLGILSNLISQTRASEGEGESNPDEIVGGYNENIIASKNIGPKHKLEFMKIKDTLDQYVNGFNSYFYEYLFQRFAGDIEKLMEEKYQKYIEISKNYHSQIKEMEYLITDDSEDQHKDYIIAIIDSLKEEQEHELVRIEDHYDKLIAETQASFKSHGFKNPGIQLMEEKFKLDMYNRINGILVPKKEKDK